jgi:hypothetical protein
MSLFHSPRIVTDGLVLCLDAANVKSYPGTGATWFDLSGNSINGTLTNSPSYNSLNSGILSFNGTNSFVSFSNTSTIHFLNRSPYSFDFWVYPRTNTTNAYPGFIDRESNPGTGRDGYNFYYTKVNITSGFNYIATERFGTGTVTNNGLTLSDAVFFNNWHYFCVVYNGNNLILYRNNVLINSLSSTHNITNTTQSLRIAQRGGNYSDSNIANVKIYNRALSSTEMSQNFNALRGRFGL